MEELLLVLDEEKLWKLPPDVIGALGWDIVCKQRLALAIAKNTEVQRNACAALDDPTKFLDALVGGKNVDAEVDKQFFVRFSYPSYSKRLKQLAQIGLKHAGLECALVGLNVILKTFDFFDDRPKDDTVEAYEQYVFLTTSILGKFFGKYTAKQIARAACRCFAPTNVSPAKQLKAARRLDPDQHNHLAGCDGLVFESVPVWDYAMVGCLLKDKVSPEQLKKYAPKIRAYQTNHMLQHGFYASPSVYKKLCV